jgi:hypothetical protein
MRGEIEITWRGGKLSNQGAGVEQAFRHANICRLEMGLQPLRYLIG